MAASYEKDNYCKPGRTPRHTHGVACIGKFKEAPKWLITSADRLWRPPKINDIFFTTSQVKRSTHIPFPKRTLENSDISQFGVKSSAAQFCGGNYQAVKHRDILHTMFDLQLRRNERRLPQIGNTDINKDAPSPAEYASAPYHETRWRANLHPEAKVATFTRRHRYYWSDTYHRKGFRDWRIELFSSQSFEHIVIGAGMISDIDAEYQAACCLVRDGIFKINYLIGGETEGETNVKTRDISNSAYSEPNIAQKCTSAEYGW